MQGETSLSKAVDCHPLITCRRPRQKKMRPERKGRLGPRAISPTPAPRRSEPTTAARSNPAQTAAHVAEGERGGEKGTEAHRDSKHQHEKDGEKPTKVFERDVEKSVVPLRWCKLRRLRPPQLLHHRRRSGKERMSWPRCTLTRRQVKGSGLWGSFRRA